MTERQIDSHVHIFCRPATNTEVEPTRTITTLHTTSSILHTVKV